MSDVKRIRENAGITQSNLARLIGVSQEALSRYETGKRKIPVDVAIKIAKELNTNVESLFQQK